jgi:GTP-binding protein LepA
MPDASRIDHIEEPYVKASLMVPNEYIGAVMELCQDKRGIYKTMEVIDGGRNQIIYELPLSEIIYDFFDKLKSCTKGYASLDYEIIGYRQEDLVRMDILLNGEAVDALSVIVHRQDAYHRGSGITIRLKELIPKQQFEIPIQAAIGGKIIAAPISNRSARTSWQSAMAVIFHGKRSCLKSRKKARRE